MRKDLPQLEFHTDYEKWMVKGSSLGSPISCCKCPLACSLCDRYRGSDPIIRASNLTSLSQLHALDCEINTTLILLAAPSHMVKFHSIVL